MISCKRCFKDKGDDKIDKGTEKCNDIGANLWVPKHLGDEEMVPTLFGG